MADPSAPYGATIMEHFRRPHNEGRLPNPDVTRDGSNPLCGDRIRIELTFRDGRIVDARFTANACAIAVAAASLLTDRVRGLSPAEVRAIDEATVIASLGAAIPPAREACALLPLATMIAALAAPPRIVTGIVLAAGMSRRFGAQKLLAPIDGIPLVRRTVRALMDSALDSIVVVVGSDREAIVSTLADLPITIAVNSDFADGMSTSLRTGIDAVGRRADAVLVALADQPEAGPPIVDRLVEHYRRTGDLIVAPRYRGVRGNPVLFDRSIVGELRAIAGDEGGRAVIMRDPGRVALVDFDIEMPKDIDHPRDLPSDATPSSG